MSGKKKKSYLCGNKKYGFIQVKNIISFDWNNLTKIVYEDQINFMD